jgi:hypothetical protein
MDQLILFHKPNKKMRSKKKMDHLIPQTKHTLSGLVPFTGPYCNENGLYRQLCLDFGD